MHDDEHDSEGEPNVARVDSSKIEDRERDPVDQPAGLMSRIGSRLTVSEWLTFFVALGSLVVSVRSCEISADTTDMQSAISHLAELANASQAEANSMAAEVDAIKNQSEITSRLVRPTTRSADAAVAQLRAQTSEFALEQRPIIDVMRHGEGFKGGPDFFDDVQRYGWNIGLLNTGRSIAYGVRYEYGLSLEGSPLLRQTVNKPFEVSPGNGWWFTAEHEPINGHITIPAPASFYVAWAHVIYEDAGKRRYDVDFCMTNLETGSLGSCNAKEAVSHLGFDLRSDPPLTAER